MKKSKNIYLIVLIALVGVIVSCEPAEDPLELFADAGQSFLDIENDGYVVQLNGTAPQEGETGTWRIYQGDYGRFEDSNDPKSAFYGEPGEIYLIGWEISVGDQYEAATINVSFLPMNPVILHDIPDTTFNNISAYLEAEAPKYGAQGQWSVIEGEGGRIEHAESHEAEFIGKENEQYTLRWTLSYGSKEEFEEFSFTTDTLRAHAGDDRIDIKTSKEEVKFGNMDAYLPAGANGTWSIVDGSTIKVYSVNDPYSIFEGVADSLYTLAWKVEIDENVSIDTLQLRFRGKWGYWTDERDGQTYRFAEVNGLEWMAENFNYAYSSEYGRSYYYGQSSRANVVSGHPVETDEERKYYGRIYNWYAAYESTPPGWRLPTAEDFVKLENHLGGPLYAIEHILEGGSTGIDFIGAGTMALSNGSTEMRDLFDAQDEIGGYWLEHYYEQDFSALGQLIFVEGESMVTPRYHAFFSGMSVRYVRDVE